MSVFNKDEDISSAPDMEPITHPKMNHTTVAKEGVCKMFSSLQVNKTMGPNELPSRLLMGLGGELT